MNAVDNQQGRAQILGKKIATDEECYDFKRIIDLYGQCLSQVVSRGLRNRRIDEADVILG